MGLRVRGLGFRVEGSGLGFGHPLNQCPRNMDKKLQNEEENAENAQELHLRSTAKLTRGRGLGVIFLGVEGLG